MWIASYYLLLIQWLSTNVYRCTRPPATSLTHISSSPWDQRKPTYSVIIHEDSKLQLDPFRGFQPV